jgi:manganese transport protein
VAVGVVITVLDVLLILFLQHKGFRLIESTVAALIMVIFGCFLYEIIARTRTCGQWRADLFPGPEIITNPAMLYVAIGILGATVMPHNLYLHSSIVQTRNFDKTPAGKKEAVKFATIDSTVSLGWPFSSTRPS